MKTYFISYNHGKGFGRMTMDSDPITKNNASEWIRETERSIMKDLDNQNLTYSKIIIINIQEIK